MSSILLIRLLLSVSSMVWFCVASASTEVLSGTVANKTLSRPEPGLPVQFVSHSVEDATVLTDTTDANGRFQFETTTPPSDEVPTVVMTRYFDVDYVSDQITDYDQPVELEVYETTDDLSVVEVVSHHLIVDAATNQASQIYILRNESDRSFRTGTGHGHGIEVPLPHGVTEFFGGPEGLHTHGSTLVDPRPVTPGGLQLAYTFALPADRRLHQQIVLPTRSVDVLITPAETEVLNTSLERVGPVSLGQRQYARLAAKEMAVGQHIEFTLAGGVSTQQGIDAWISEEKGPWIIGGIAIVAMLAITIVKIRQRTQEASPAGELGPELRRTALLEQIADLDDRLDNGRIEAQEHERRRDALKAEVLDLTRSRDTPS